MKHVIDASGKKLGRVASQAAALLMGKMSPDFQRHQMSLDMVEIVNASGLAIDERKKGEKIYKRYSGYPGGLREISMKKVIASKGYAEVLKKAIGGMIPRNRMKDRVLKKLVVKE